MSYDLSVARQSVRRLLRERRYSTAVVLIWPWASDRQPRCSCFSTTSCCGRSTWTALGATRAQVMWANVRTSRMVLAAAMPIGAALSLFSGAWLADLVYAVQPRDGVSLAAALAIATTVGLLGMLLPVRRAAGENIMKILRES